MLSVVYKWTLVIVSCLVMYTYSTYIEKYCEKCLLEAGEGYYRVPGYCNLFSHCAKTTQDLATCPPGTFFDANSRRCKHAADVICPDDPCLDRDDGYSYSDGIYCYGFYTCEAGRSVYGKCPAGEGFDGNSCFPDESCQHYTAEYGTGCPSYLSACPGDNSKYYLEGAGGIQYTMSCPSVLRFNPSICVCDWGFGPSVDECQPLFNFEFHGNTLDEYNRASLTICGAVAPTFEKALFEDEGHAILWMMDGLDLGSKFVLSFDFQYVGKELGEVALMGNDYKDDESFTLKLTFDTETEEVIARILLADDTEVIMTVPYVAALLNHRVWLAKSAELLTLKVDDLPLAVEKHVAGIKIKNTPLVIGTTSGCTSFKGYMDNIQLSRCPEHVDYRSHELDK